MKKFFAITCLLFPLIVQAQNEIDALRYSRIGTGGTTRFVSTGGAFGALGGDVSVASTNPAGIGLFRKSELTFTPGAHYSSVSQNFMGTKTMDARFNIYASNAAMVLTFPYKSNQSGDGWISTNLAIGYNRLTDFNQRLRVNGVTSSSSLSRVFLDQANSTSAGLEPEDLEVLFPFEADLAFKTYLLDTIDSTSYFSAVGSGAVNQRHNVLSRGGLGETFLTFSANYSNRLYLGGTIGFEHVRYIEQSVHEETDHKDTIDDFKSFSYNQNLTTTGSGYNIKFGFIYRLTDFARIGGAIHSPTVYSLSDSYSSAITTNFDDGTTFDSKSPNGNFDYQLSTPFKALASVAFIIGKQGFLTAEYEYSDYSVATLSSNLESFNEANANIDAKYRSTGNLRLGGEYKYNEFAFRAGYGYYPSPYHAGVNTDASKMVLSGGLGIRENNYFIDFGYVRSIYNEQYFMYAPKYNLAPSTGKITSGMFQATLGFSF